MEIKFRTFKKLLQFEQNGWPWLEYPHYEESWIIGCYKHYQSNITDKSIEKWWKGCLKKYNKERKELKSYYNGNQ